MPRGMTRSLGSLPPSGTTAGAGGRGSKPRGGTAGGGGAAQPPAPPPRAGPPPPPCAPPRAGRAGWPCWYFPEARVVHLVGRSSGVTDPRAARKRRPGYWFRARRRYFLRNHGRAATLLADLAWTLGYASFRLRRLVLRKPGTDPQWLFWDFIRYNFLLARR